MLQVPSYVVLRTAVLSARSTTVQKQKQYLALEQGRQLRHRGPENEGDLLFFGVVLFVLFAETAHSGTLVGMCRVVVRVRAFHFDGFL